MTTTTEAPPEQSAETSAAEAAAPQQSSPGRAGGLVGGIGLNEGTMQRIRDCGSFEVTNEPEKLTGATIVALSTRMDRGQSPQMPADVDPLSTPIVVICHPGGEETAVTLMQQGCAGVIAEGNERALGSFIDPDSHTDLLVEAFLEQQGRGGGNLRHCDPVTNLPELASFEMRLGEFIEAGTPPNVVMMHITNLDKVRDLTDARAVNLLRRRLASFYSDAARRTSSEVFSLSESRFAVLDGAQLLLDPAAFANELIVITEAFRPAGIRLRLAVGAVIASTESEVMAIRDQAEQAVMAAAQNGESSYVTAEDVTLLLAPATEYNVAQMLVSFVDQQAPNPSGHSGRVADLANDIACEIGIQGRDLNSLRLAALLHDVGRVPLEEDEQEADESYPERGARYLLASAGPTIADAVRYHTERWDGAGPGALVEDDIPLAARIIAIAKAADSWLRPPNGEAALRHNDVIEKLEKESGTRFDPSLVETAIRLFGQA